MKHINKLRNNCRLSEFDILNINVFLMRFVMFSGGGQPLESK